MSKREAGVYAILETTMGRMVCRLFADKAPRTVENFIELAEGRKEWTDHNTNEYVKRPFYNGLAFHRVIPDFMIQTGAHLADGSFRQSESIADEFGPGLKHDRAGILSMANAGPNTGSSQFFITHRATPHLDGKHAVFGRVVEGQEVVVAIGNARRDASDKPLQPVLLNKVTIERVSVEPAATK